MRLYTVLSLFLVLISASICFAVDVRVSWNTVDPQLIDGYHVYYSSVSPDGPFDGDEALNGPSPIVVPADQSSLVLQGLADNKAYYFSVTAFNDSQEGGFSQPTSNYWMPVLTSPSDGQSGVSTNPEFRWSSPPENESDYIYILRVGTSPGNLREFNPAGLAGPAFTPPPTAGSAAVVMFTLLLLSLLLVSANQIKTVKSAVRYAGAGAFLMLAISCSSGGDSSTTTTSVPRTTAEQLEPNTTYFWSVTADNGAVTTESTVASFTTGN